MNHKVYFMKDMNKDEIKSTCIYKKIIYYFLTISGMIIAGYSIYLRKKYPELDDSFLKSYGFTLGLFIGIVGGFFRKIFGIKSII